MHFNDHDFPPKHTPLSEEFYASTKDEIGYDIFPQPDVQSSPEVADPAVADKIEVLEEGIRQLRAELSERLGRIDTTTSETQAQVGVLGMNIKAAGKTIEEALESGTPVQSSQIAAESEVVRDVPEEPRQIIRRKAVQTPAEAEPEAQEIELPETEELEASPMPLVRVSQAEAKEQGAAIEPNTAYDNVAHEEDRQRTRRNQRRTVLGLVAAGALVGGIAFDYVSNRGDVPVKNPSIADVPARIASKPVAKPVAKTAEETPVITSQGAQASLRLNEVIKSHKEQAKRKSSSKKSFGISTAATGSTVYLRQPTVTKSAEKKSATPKPTPKKKPSSARKTQSSSTNTGGSTYNSGSNASSPTGGYKPGGETYAGGISGPTSYSDSAS